VAPVGPWRIFVAGGADGVEWEKVLRSLSGTPSWVVCDDDKGIKAAVRSVWPNAVIHTCEGHLCRLLLDRLAADGQDPSGSFANRAPGALADPQKWAIFVADANAAGLAHTSRWLAGKDRVMRRQFAARQADRPYSNGAIETVFDAITKRLWTRRFVFRNHARLEVALRLMLLDQEGVADELRYREAIRSSLLAGGGQPTRTRRSLDDPGGSSIYAEVRSVMARTAAKRTQNARHARASYKRKKAANISRTQPRSARRLRASGGVGP
jgi:Transposase, Mutator family